MKFINLVVIALVVFTIACNRKGKSNCKPYFEFDQLEHYSILTTPDEEAKLMELDSLTADELRLNDVLIQSNCAKLADTIRLMNLESIGFTKKIVPPSKFKAVNSFFCEKKHKESISTACIYVYRDVLIFRSKGRIVGTAKICFECMAHVIAGTNADTFDFGQSGDYQKLRKLLY